MLPELKIKIGVDIEKVGPSVDALKKKIQSLRTVSDTIGKAFKNVGDEFIRMGVSFSKFNLGVAATIGALGSVAKKSTQYAASVGENAKQTGLTAEAYQELAHAVTQISDMTEQQFVNAMEELNLKLGEAAAGSEYAQEKFEALGLDIEGIKDGTVGAEEAFSALVGAIEKSPTSAAAAASAAAILGEEASRLGSAIFEAQQTIDGIRAEAKELGIVIPEDAVENAIKFNQNVEKLRSSLRAMFVTTSTQLLPVFNDQFVPLLENHLLPIMSEVVGKIGNWMDAFAVLDPEIQAVIGTIVAGFAVGGPVLIAIGAVSKAIGALVAASGPIGLFIVAAGLLTAAWVTWGDDIKAAIGGALDWVSNKVDEFLNFFMTLPSKLKEIGVNMIQGLKEGISQKWEEMKGWMYGLTAELPQWMRDVLGIHSPSTVFAEIGQNMIQGLVVGLTSAEGSAKAKMQSIGNQLKSMARQILERVKTMLVVNPLINALTGAIGMPTNLPVWSFAGGGKTPRGVRAGGLDGKGGMMAMVHPNETIVDETTGGGGGGGGGGVTQVFNITVNQANQDLNPQRIMQEMKAFTKQTMLEAMHSGGIYGRAVR